MKKSAILINLKDKLKTLLSDKKKSTVICVLLIILIISYFLLSNFKNSTQPKMSNSTESLSISDYSKSVELKLESMLNDMNEINSVSVMVMIESTPQIQYLTESDHKTESDEKGSTSTITTTVVFEKNGSVSTPVVVTTILPKIIGVLIVTNNISPSTKVSILNSVSVVLNVDVSCISILQKG